MAHFLAPDGESQMDGGRDYRRAHQGCHDFGTKLAPLAPTANRRTVDERRLRSINHTQKPATTTIRDLIDRSHTIAVVWKQKCFRSAPKES